MNINLEKVKGLEEIHPNIRNLLLFRNLRKCKDVLNLSNFELSQKLNLSPQKIESLLEIVSNFATPQRMMKTVFEMNEKMKNKENYVKTGIPELDDALLGGIPCGSVTEIVGNSGVGKTQFCFTLAVKKASSGRVLYYDSELRFSEARIREIILSQYEGMSSSGLSSFDKDDVQKKELVDSILKSIFQIDIQNVEQMIEEFEELENKIIDERIDLVILDSIANPIRRKYGKEKIVERTYTLNRCASILKNVAELYHIPIVVTNHITFGKELAPFFEENLMRHHEIYSEKNEKMVAALGNTWYHCVNTRLFFQNKKRGGGSGLMSSSNSSPFSIIKKIIIDKSPLCPVSSIEYKITRKGVEAVKLGEKDESSQSSYISEKEEEKEEAFITEINHNDNNNNGVLMPSRKKRKEF